MGFKLWQSRSDLKPLPHWWKGLYIRTIGAHHHTCPQQNAKNWGNRWGSNFSFKSPSTSGLLPPSDNHILHNQSCRSELSMCKFFCYYSQEHTVQAVLRNILVMPYIKRTPCILDLVPFGCTLLTFRIPWQPLISSRQFSTSHKWCLWLSPACWFFQN